MPAVSTSTKSPCSVLQRASIVSMVVPGRGSTITRSSPSSAFTSDDFPTLGRPTIATRGAPSSGSTARSGSIATTSSSRSPIPVPFSAEMARGSPSPRRKNSLSDRGLRLVHLVDHHQAPGAVTAQVLGDRPVEIRDAGARVGHEQHRVRQRDRLFGLAPHHRVARLARAGRKPPVSTSMNARPAHSARAALRSRVMPGRS